MSATYTFVERYKQKSKLQCTAKACNANTTWASHLTL
jgi:hypothetical protein